MRPRTIPNPGAREPGPGRTYGKPERLGRGLLKASDSGGKSRLSPEAFVRLKLEEAARLAPAVPFVAAPKRTTPHVRAEADAEARGEAP